LLVESTTEAARPRAPTESSVATPVIAQPAPATLVGRLIALCAPLYLALAATKFAMLQPGWTIQPKALIAYFIYTLTLSFQDLLYVIGIGLFAYLPLKLTAKSPRLHKIIWAALIALVVFNAIYAVVSVQVIEFLGTPLTLPLLRMAGDVKSMRSSTAQFVSPATVVFLLAAPAICLALTRGAIRSRFFESRLVRAALLVLFVADGALASFAYGRWFRATTRETLARNAVIHFILSCSTRMSGGESAALDPLPPVAYMDDFRTFADRKIPRSGTADLSANRPRNVIVVVLESTSTYYLGAYGSAFEATPRLKAEAANALVFDNFYAHAGYTVHSLIPIAMSTYAGMGWRIYVEDYPDLIGTTMAQVLHPLGYRTAFITSQDLDYQGVGTFLKIVATM